MSDDPFVDLIARARVGDGSAVEALLQHCVPQLKRWARGRLPPVLRSTVEMDHLVDETARYVLPHLVRLEPTDMGVLQFYLRQAVINRICAEIRRFFRQSAPVQPPED